MTVQMFDAIRVEILDDYYLVSAFMRWQLDNKIFGFRGSSSGQGNSIDTFPSEYKEQIEEFFNGQS